MAKKSKKKPPVKYGLDTGMTEGDLRRQEKHLERLFFNKDGTPKNKIPKADPVD